MLKHVDYRFSFYGTIIAIILAILLVSSIKESQTFAEENQSDSVNDVAIRTIFHFRAGDEEINTFKVFKQVSGFIRTKSPTFDLEGVVNGDRPLLYEAVDFSFYQPNVQNNYSMFNVDVYLYSGDAVYRHFTYKDCSIGNYWVDTEFDKEETYSGKTKFAIVDKFEFQCNGFMLKNPIFEQHLKENERSTETLHE
jgi:hypothetical protein